VPKRPANSTFSKLKNTFINIAKTVFFNSFFQCHSLKNLTNQFLNIRHFITFESVFVMLEQALGHLQNIPMFYSGLLFGNQLGKKVKKYQGILTEGEGPVQLTSSLR